MKFNRISQIIRLDGVFQQLSNPKQSTIIKEIMVEYPLLIPGFTTPPRIFWAADVDNLAHDLLGCLFLFGSNAGLSGGIVAETEAYSPDDPASHSYAGLTARNATMFGPAGCLYVYFIYGRYFCANITCGHGCAVLIRQLRPSVGLAAMQNRRPAHRQHLSDGPGKLCQALGINQSHNGLTINDQSTAADQPKCHLLQPRQPVSEQTIRQARRIGISKAVERERRFFLVE